MSYDPTKLFFTDCKTTGVDHARHEAWEIAWIVWDSEFMTWREEVRRIWPQALQCADPIALSINQFYQRTEPVVSAPVSAWDDPRAVAEEIAYASAGRHIVGACPWFDARFYEKLLLANGYTPAWHYHMIDVEALAVGWLSGFQDVNSPVELPLPWKSEWLSEQLGITRPDKSIRHTALGDTREVKATFEFITGTDYEFPKNAFPGTTP